MGLITRLRGMVGGGAVEEDEIYECGTCGATFDTSHQLCPSCGARRVQLVE